MARTAFSKATTCRCMSLYAEFRDYINSAEAQEFDHDENIRGVFMASESLRIMNDECGINFRDEIDRLGKIQRKNKIEPFQLYIVKTEVGAKLRKCRSKGRK